MNSTFESKDCKRSKTGVGDRRIGRPTPTPPSSRRNCGRSGLNHHLAEVEKAVTPGAHAVLILDGAGWHTSKDLNIPDNISLLKLPAYAPELNPVENVWQFCFAGSGPKPPPPSNG